MNKYKYKGQILYIPTKKQDVTLGKYLEIASLFSKDSDNNIDIVDIFNVLIDSEVDLFNAEDVGLQALILEQTTWINELITDCQKVKFHKVIEWEGKKIKIPNSFGQMTLGQRMMIAQARETYDSDQDYKQYVSTCICIFLAPSIYGKDWSDEIDLMISVIQEHEAVKLMQLANFFFIKNRSLTAFGVARLCFQRMNTQIKHKLKGLINLV